MALFLYQVGRRSREIKMGSGCRSAHPQTLILLSDKLSIRFMVPTVYHLILSLSLIAININNINIAPTAIIIIPPHMNQVLLS